MSRPKSPEPFPGAMPFEGLEVPRAPFNPEQRRAFGSVPRLLGVNLELDLQLSAADKSHVTFDYLRESLYSKEGQSVDGLALNPAEYSTILINPPTFEKRIGAQAENAHKYSNPLRREEAKLNAPLHAYRYPNGLLDSHRVIVAALTTETTALAELKSYIGARGYALTTEARIRELATYTWQNSFDNLLRVNANQRNWSPRELHGAVEAMAKYLFTGPQNERVGYWGGLTDLASTYAKQKRVLFTLRQHMIESRIKAIEKQRDEFYTEHGLTPLS